MLAPLKGGRALFSPGLVLGVGKASLFSRKGGDPTGIEPLQTLGVHIPKSPSREGLSRGEPPRGAPPLKGPPGGDRQKVVISGAPKNPPFGGGQDKRRPWG